MNSKRVEWCVRCEALGKKVPAEFRVKDEYGEEIPLCSSCVIIIKEEQLLLIEFPKEEDE